MIFSLLGIGRWERAAAQTPPPTLEVQVDEALRKQAFVEVEQAAQTHNGSVLIIVQLAMRVQPEGSLSLAQAQAQRQAIANAQATITQALRGTGASSIRTFMYIPFMALRADVAALRTLQASPLVANIAEDVPEPATLLESTALIGASTPGTGAWAQGYGGAGQVIAILDTGVDKHHPFITPGKVVAEACFSNAGGGGGGTSLCTSGSTGNNAALDCDVTIVGCGHGTHVAGIAAGKAYAGMESAAGSSFSGVAPDASLIAIKVFTRFDDGGSNQTCASSGVSSPCALTFPSDQALALQHLYNLRTTYSIATANMSLGGGKYTSVSECEANPNNSLRKAAIDQLLGAGIGTVIASGNSGHTDGLAGPACISTAVSVGAVGDGSGGSVADQVQSFSNSASFLDLLAPGAVIRSSTDGTFEDFVGTSMAAPHVAGAWAILKQLAPNASVSAIQAVLENTGVSVLDIRNGITKKRIRLPEAIQLMLMPPMQATPSPASFGTVGVDLSGLLVLTLQNVSTVSISITPSLNGAGVAYTGGGGFPGSGGTCATTITAGQMCTVRLTYAPLSGGTLSGSFIATYINSVGLPFALTIPLSGVADTLCPSNRLSNARLEKSGTWTQSDNVGGQALPLCPSGICSVGSFAPAGPYSGGGWGWFGGYTTTVPSKVTQILTQTATVPSGTATLQFNLNISRADAGANANDMLRVRLGNTYVFTATAAEASTYTAYKLVRLNINQFATGGSQTLVFSATTSTGPVINLNVDDVALCAPAYYPMYLPTISR